MQTMTDMMRRALLLAVALTATLAMVSRAATAAAAPPADDGSNGSTVSGVVTDKASGAPMVQVSVAIWQDGHLATGTTTDADGKFSLKKPAGKFEMRVSFVGYKPQVIPMSRCRAGMTVSMDEDSHQLQEFVVNGFFTQQKNSFTGSASQVSVEELKQVSGTNLLTALAALTPGMEMVENTLAGSNPNHTPEIIIRGMSSFSNNDQTVNQPTIILDGTEISMQELYDLDMNEIENINVLKDAAATALYGSKAANGVIVITRKPIPTSTLRVAYNLTANVQFPMLGSYDMLNAAEKLEYERLAGLYDAAGTRDPLTGQPRQWELDRLYNERYQRIRRGQDTDWLSQPARTAFSHDHSLRAYGGASNIRYELSARVGNTHGVMKGDYRRRYNVGFKLDYFLNNALKISNRSTYAEISAKDSPYGSFAQYVRMNPYDPAYNADGTLNNDLSWNMDNPLYEATLGSFSKNGTRTFTNATDLRWELTKELRLTGHFNISSGTTWSEAYKSPDSRTFKDVTDLNRKGSRTQGDGKSVDYNGNVVLSYNKMFSDESLASVNLGWEINHSESNSATTDVVGFYADNLSYIGNAAGYPPGGIPYGTQAETADVGFFGNAVYSFRNRYFADFTYRTTGSSQFGENQRFGHFWAAGAGWNILNEKFMEPLRQKVDLLKLRASAGYTGKVNFSPFQAITMYRYSGSYVYSTGIGAVPITIGNVDLCWERTMTYNAGLDLSMFGRRLNLSADVYLKKTKDLLLDKSKAPSTGVTSAKENLGELQNTGLELKIDGYIFQQKDFSWKLGTTGYLNRNKITRINSALEEINKNNDALSAYSNTPLPQYAEGESVTALKVVRSAGIDPATGREVYIKRNGELTFDYDPADKVLIGDTEPRFTQTVNTNLYYKGFSLYALFNIRYGAWLYNDTRSTRVEGTDPKYNADQRVFDERWKQPGDVAVYRNIADTSAPQKTDRFAEKDNTLTLTSLNLSYEFPKALCQRLSMRNLRVGINFTDLLRLSSVKIERGTNYLYSQGFELTLSTVF